MTKKWVVLALLLGTLFASLAMLMTGRVAADLSRERTYHETFASTTYRDASRTTAVWDTAAGQLRLHVVPSSERMERQLYYPSAWSPAVYVSSTGHVYLFGGTGRPNAIQEYDPETNSTVRSTLLLPYSFRGSAAIYAESSNAIHLLGGSGTNNIVVLDVAQGITRVLANRLPGPLAYASAVYVPNQDKAYIFGGLGPDAMETNTILEYDVTAGVIVTLPVTLPLYLSESAAVYDPTTESAYIFGGRAFGTAFRTILKFDVVHKTAPTVTTALPQPCSGGAAVYVPGQRKAYIFGGLDSPLYMSQIVEFDMASEKATALTATLPIRLYGAAAAYVPSQAKAYIFGGQSSGPPVPGIVAFDVNARTATDITTWVDGRSGASAIYVPNTRKAYLFGGESESYIGLGYRESSSRSILVYDMDRLTRSELPATLPISRTDTAAVYVSTTNQVYIFGGWRPGKTPRYFADILRLDLATGAVSTRSAPLPAARAGMAAAYVPATGKAYLFGGFDGSNYSSQILAYDPAQDAPPTALSHTLPVPVAYAAAAYDATTGKVYLFGGQTLGEDGDEDYVDRIVAFDPASETATLLSAELPTPRARVAAVVVPGESMIYVMGGTAGYGSYRTDIIAFNTVTGVATWLFGVRLGEARFGEVAAYVPERNTAYLFGGTGSREQSLFGIAALQFTYALSETAQSLRVNAAGQGVQQAVLTAEQSLADGSASYALSNDGGQTWANVQTGVTHTFTSPGFDLRWRAVLNGDGETTPIVNGLTITYEGPTQHVMVLPLVLKAYRR